MKIVDAQVRGEYHQKLGIDGIYEAIRDAAAICYQTDIEKMSKSPKEFVEDVLLKNGHTRPLEFGTVYLIIPNDDNKKYVSHYIGNPYSRVNFEYDDTHELTYYVTTNMRVIMQGLYRHDNDAFRHGYNLNYLSDLQFLCDEPTVHHDIRRTFTIWASRGCTDDMRTHITLSSICESTRFCNYSKNKFNNELTFIRPYWITPDVIDGYMYNPEKSDTHNSAIAFLNSFKQTENDYMYIMGHFAGIQPQQLKRVLNLNIKAELRLCGFDSAWQNFFWRRCDSHADPECTFIANKIKEMY